MAEPTPITIVANGAGDGGATAAVNVSSFGTLRLDFTVAAIGGKSRNPPLLTVVLETSADGVADWRELAVFQATAVGTERRAIGRFDNFVRARWTASSKEIVDGTPTPHGFHWSLAGQAV